ncbi:MAG: N-acetyl-gamma-glutamyl-phosphate reductase [Deltaproteobacteria bacterium]
MAQTGAHPGKIKVGILGATGYTGYELLRLLAGHSGVEVSWLTSETFCGRFIYEVFPQMRRIFDLKCLSAAKFAQFERADLVFSCLPHGASMRFAGEILGAGARLIDFSADFRFKDPRAYERVYKSPHSAESLIGDAVYGLPEINRSAIKRSALTANPGCYATGAILGLLPLLGEGVLPSGAAVIIDSKAGITGGGRAPTLQRHFSESNEGASAAGEIASHSQKPEIESIIQVSSTSSRTEITFMAHRIPVNRGILTTIYTQPRKSSPRDLWDLFSNYYEGEPFIRICADGKTPETKSVRYSNFCDIGFGFQGKWLVIITALDNLGKGASAQAVQNMNLMFGFHETEGLRQGGVFP